ncbi:Uma2 family endonuclease [Nostoc sp. FACHB-87]|uniref:Uma2 family endonuclease n=1 Tax=Nostocaceae TaxID=1162 RepID=UPI001689A73F|nr:MULTISPECIES: Uma2 family endonuclease [Nostocaceae]MBD2454963.1 Uma2 family endonuclease [Nostoc sp. FACHB-87]MBD2474716.1 Uma2 family endonuclease [Anabaena sp. FACHB-83]
MAQALPRVVTFAEFAAWRPEGGRYELHDGVIVEMAQPVGGHEGVVGFLVEEVVPEYKRLKLPYFLPKTALVKPPDNESGYSPDILLLNRKNLVHEPLWKKESTVMDGASIPLIIEIVSTNWRDDYHKKFADYEIIGVSEYWIVDYAALGGREFIGNPKEPTIFICELVDGEYVKRMFRGNDVIVSPSFPNLNFTAQQVFDAALTEEE